MREVLLLLAIGLAIGLPAAFALGRFVSTQLYRNSAPRSEHRDLDDAAVDPGVVRGRRHPRAPR